MSSLRHFYRAGGVQMRPHGGASDKNLFRFARASRGLEQTVSKMTKDSTDIEQYALHDDIGCLAKEWHSLLDKKVRGSFFQSPLWVLNYSRYRKKAGFGPHLLAVRAPEGQLIGVLPLATAPTRWRILLPTVRAAHAASEYESDWIAHPAHIPEFVNNICQYLDDRKSTWYKLELNSVTAESAVLAALKNECKRRRLIYDTRSGWRIPYVNTEDTSVDALQLTTGKYRRELTRRWRKLNELGEVRFESYEYKAQVEQAFEEFIGVERSGWKGDRASAIACQPDVHRFWRHFAIDAADAGCLRLHLLRLNNDVISGQLGVHWGRCYYCLKVGFDPRFQSFGPGALLTRHVLQQCIENPLVDVYDFAGPANEYMWNWTCHYSQMEKMWVGSPHWLKGNIFKAMNHARTLYRWGRKNLVAAEPKG